MGKRLIGLVLASSLVFSSTGAIASTGAPAAMQSNPWVTLTAMSGGAAATALCGASAAMAAVQSPGTGCVLPAVDSAPSQAIPAPIGGVSGAGINPLYIALGVAAAGVLLYFLLRHHHHDREANSPA